jgi:hypothetical protein
VIEANNFRLPRDSSGFTVKSQEDDNPAIVALILLIADWRALNPDL